MQKNIINIVIIIAVFLGFYFLYSYLAPESETGNRWMFRKEVQNPPYDEVLKNSADQAEKDIAIYNEAIKNRSSELCLTIGDIGQKKSCLDMIGATLALDEKNIEKCSVLSSSGMIVRCQDNIYYSLSTEKNNKESCRSIQDENIAKNCIESVEKSLFVLANASGSISSSICATFESSIA